MRHDSLSSHPPAAEKTNRLAQFGLCLLLAAVTLLVYLPVRQHAFVSYDDPVYVTGNRHVQSGLTWAGVKWAFTTGYAGNWHPITWLSHMLDRQLFGPGPAGPHIVNVLLHAANAILLFILLRQLTGALWRSALVAALFALHPLHVESVAWVSERKDVLSAFFGLLTLLLYMGKWRVESGEWRVKTASPFNSPSPSLNPQLSTLNYSLALLCFALALMSKPMLVTLPFVMLLLDYWPLQRSAIGYRRLAMEKAPFFALSALSCVMTFVVQKKGGAVQSLSHFTVSERIGNAAVSYARYLAKTFWPADLAVPYPHPGHWPAGMVVWSGLLIAALCFAALWFGRKLPFMTTGWFWFFGMLIPTIGLVQVGDQSMADRYTYLPSIGAFLLLVWIFGEAFTRWQLPKTLFAVLAGTALIACVVTTRNQLHYWQDSESLFRRALAVTKKNSLAHNNLGNALLDQGQKDAAITQFRQALEIEPDYPDAHINLGNALREQGQLDAAADQFQAALRIQPDSAEAHYNLGNLLLQMGKPGDAIVHFRKAADSSPDHVMARNNLANTLLQTGDVDEAIRFYREALEIRPDFVAAHHNLGSILLRRGQADEAIAHFRRVVELQPDTANVYNNLGWMLRQTGHWDEAAVQLEKALKLQPDYPEAHVNLAKTFLLMGKAPEAISHFRAALKLQPDDSRTLADLAWVLATWPEAPVRNGTEAVELAQRASSVPGPENPALLEALAAAFAEAGNFAEAAAAIQRAQTLAETQSNPALAETLRSQLKLFQAGTPLREKIPLPGN